jgi:hypothetical protein
MNLLLILIIHRKDFNPETVENLVCSLYELCASSQSDSLFEISKLGLESVEKLLDLHANKLLSLLTKVGITL